MSGPSVTILMTVRNGEPYIKEAVQSILSQAYSDFKFLILDNASKDYTREIIRDFRDPRIELLELEVDLGQTGALNHGLVLTDTPYIARMDADDISHPARLERQVKFLSEHPQVALLGTGFEIIDPDGQVTSRYSPPVEHTEILKTMLFENPFAHSSVVFSRTAVMVCGGYDVFYKCAQDYALWWRVALCHRVANLPEFLVQIRSHPGQTSYTWRREIPGELRQIVRGTLNDPNLPEEVRSLKRRAQGYADVKYAAGISEVGCRFRSFIWLVRGIAQAPSLIIYRDAIVHVARALRHWPILGTLWRLKRISHLFKMLG